jgi:hypothetical protein
MPRATKLKKCECGKQPRFGVATTFYMLRRRRDAVRTQFKGTLPAQGYCALCFFRLLRSEDIPHRKRERLIAETKQELRARRIGGKA